jgi:UDP-glucose 4-epimerase
MKNYVRLIFASTSDVYGKNPALPFTETSDLMIGSPENKRWAYALSKLHTEFLLCAANRSSGLPFQIMRFFGCYGPKMAEGWWGGPQSVFIEQALNKTAFSIHGDGTQTRSYLYVDDLVNAVVRLVEEVELDSGIWNICGDPSTEISVFDLVKEIQSLTNPSEAPEIEWIPYASFGQYEDVMRRVGSAEKAFNHLGWKAETTLREGLKRTIDWMKQQSNDAKSV